MEVRDEAETCNAATGWDTEEKVCSKISHFLVKQESLFTLMLFITPVKASINRNLINTDHIFFIICFLELKHMLKSSLVKFVTRVFI